MSELSISTELVPLSISKAKRENAHLKIKVKNTSPEAKLLSIELAADNAISLNKGMPSRFAKMEVGLLEPNQAAEFTADVYPTFESRGSGNLSVNVLEHFKDYDHVLRKHAKNVIVRIV